MFDDRVPWERDVFVNLLVSKVKEENDKVILKNQENRVAARKGK